MGGILFQDKENQKKERKKEKKRMNVKNREKPQIWRCDVSLQGFKTEAGLT